MPFVNPWPESIKDVVHGNHTVKFRASVQDPHWPDVYGPMAAIPLDVVDFTMDWDVDRTPHGRFTLTATIPSNVQWVSPLHRSLWCFVFVRYWDHAGVDLGEGYIGAFHVRRRTLDYEKGEMTLDMSTYDQELSDYYERLEVTAP